MLEYRAAYSRCPDTGWYTARVLDFPGAVSQGRTLESARRMLRDALRELAEHLMEQGEPLPRPAHRAADRKADVVEPIRLSVRVESGASATGGSSRAQRARFAGNWTSRSPRSVNREAASPSPGSDGLSP